MTLPYISDLQLFLSVLAAMVAVTAWLGIAALLHDRCRRSVPLRIHVAGSRGKTTTARLIGSALRADGRKVLVKTTGTDPVLILPDGSERPWRRWGPPSIAEQVRFFREARRRGVDAVVLESMAIEPEYLWASEEYLVRATHTVITNVRPDHVEVVGTDPRAAAHAMSLVLPQGGKVFLSGEAAVEEILDRAGRRSCRVATIASADRHHDDVNRALALAVCTSVGIGEDIGRAGFERAGSDAGAFVIAQAIAGGRTFRFANAFSCNDPESFERLWSEVASGEAPVVLFNLRDDRPERTKAFLHHLAKLRPMPRIFTTGFIPTRWVRAAGLDLDRVGRLRTGSARKALETLAAAAPDGSLIWGVGNYSRLGRDITAILRAEGRPC
jgi:poly-gamma-glutamate synthase PgsB/CapB